MLKKSIFLTILCCFVLTGCVTSSVKKYPYRRAKKGVIIDGPKPPSVYEWSHNFLGSYNPEPRIADITKPPFPKAEKKMKSPQKKIERSPLEIIEKYKLATIKNRTLKKTKPKTISEIIKESTKQAIRVPKKESFQQSIIRYSYEEGAVFTVQCTPGFLTDIVLQKGERIINLSAGDTANFLVEHIANDPEHVLIKPLISQVETNLMIHTSKRNYYISLKSSEKIYMNAVAFSYPKEKLAKMKAKVNALKKQSHYKFKAEDLSFDYIIESACKDACLEPLSVFEDKKRGKIYIAMPKEIKHKALPAVFAIDARGISEMINYRFVDNKFVLDTLVSRLMLQYGGKNREIYIYKSGFKSKQSFGSFLNSSKFSNSNPDNQNSER